MDSGVLLPTGNAQWVPGGDPRDLVGFARAAERAGFASLWVNDSLISPRIEALTMLAALAPATDRVTLGTAALLPFLRRPVQAAQAPFYDLSEVPWERRFTRLDETVALWRALWDGAAEFHGELLSTVRVDTDVAACRRVLDDYARVNYGMPLADLERIQAVVTGTAGSAFDRAVVEEAAQRVLTRWDEHVTHHEVAVELTAYNS
ncbi:LLM class flavin-dependent oxidoreductase [Dactylosporangium sucinum]|uniref:Luciferase-like domain-containing protein n=1 Tax=Dactylosporangium sucinum TaxID=1424081 RepID=A0A917UDF3_9ACTN|nr:LLM class flavin-dependent oxidoreductase [Dactylosporangium sucinum]GGM78383.1 hypothetical protein GCM10007977_094890 [Dactylosporangium sucinum]